METRLLSRVYDSRMSDSAVYRVKILRDVPFMVMCLLTLSGAVYAEGGHSASWTPLTHKTPVDSVETLMLLTDGTVFAQSGSDFQTWLKLTPDQHGSYVDGTWTTLAPMSIPRLYFASDVLQDGRVGFSAASIQDRIWTRTGHHRLKSTIPSVTRGRPPRHIPMKWADAFRSLSHRT